MNIIATAAVMRSLIGLSPLILVLTRSRKNRGGGSESGER